MTAPRQRRRPAELRPLILDGAARVFSSKGYARATTEDIAESAGVSVSVIYRHFKDKADLYRETLLEPFAKSLQQYTATWDRSFSEAPLDDLAIMRELVTDIYDNLQAHREIVAALSTAGDVLTPEVSAEIRQAFAQIFAQIGAMGVEEAKRRGWFRGETIGLTARCLFSLIASMIVYEQWFLPHGSDRISREDLIEHITKLTLYGLRLEPPFTE